MNIYSIYALFEVPHFSRKVGSHLNQFCLKTLKLNFISKNNLFLYVSNIHVIFLDYKMLLSQNIIVTYHAACSDCRPVEST